ncbi:ClbS/DfsB family four-helix bundle protein [Phocoenobacter skyensis]|uniref:ClbS/DfsB family four-helix bundle protein n=1 Tax=Phocoenobacter skyensis TaxID=97481 RepID=A0A1H7Y6T9_9PAST|nr:ClbS/DfsB family four-helix bundle protein [Pasteurella skyensis]MDP8079942.1 ClbS/DfsB family four-helix bundle protein [Pasteurella skyensis]MDP8085838.1 ClbS/DfsB family four-helix bundle protein [Pasteurella skyensis]MDP8171576.1 ClbS/DfsB family four-helix bundle protein [Pasteurella skyensis]MDP8175805.1 ClbS/DfsB family four-helix bundle protein [Pasteurella skyensis]MDP8185718.1 ClbS/DfsB family four-helix bundle protein [Pasteurella skyensis]
MARPKTKEELVEVANINFEKLWQLIYSLTEKEFMTEFDFSANPKLKEAHWRRDKNVRDILIHLYEWHQLLLNWIIKNQAGEVVSFLPAPYTFKNIAEMNIKFQEKHRNTSYEQAVKMLKDSHNKVMDMVDSFTNEELFTKKYFSWTGTTSLGSYCISGTSSHYDWAIKKLKMHKKYV